MSAAAAGHPIVNEIPYVCLQLPNTCCRGCNLFPQLVFTDGHRDPEMPTVAFFARCVRACVLQLQQQLQASHPKAVETSS